MSERLGHRYFKGAHACLEAHEALIDGLEPPIHGLEPPIHSLEPLMDFGPEALQLLVHQEHAFGHQLDPRLEVLGYDIEVAAGLRIANPHLCPQLVEAPIHLGGSLMEVANQHGEVVMTTKGVNFFARRP